MARLIPPMDLPLGNPVIEERVDAGEQQCHSFDTKVQIAEGGGRVSGEQDAAAEEHHSEAGENPRHEPPIQPRNGDPQHAHPEQPQVEPNQCADRDRQSQDVNGHHDGKAPQRFLHPYGNGGRFEPFSDLEKRHGSTRGE